MSKHSIRFYVLWLISPLLFGCAYFGPTVMKTEKPQPNIDVLLTKLKSNVAKVNDGKEIQKNVGVAIKLGTIVVDKRIHIWRTEEEVYKMVSSKVILSLEKAGISASLIYNETDPRLENIGIILHVEYSERIATAKVWDDKLTTVQIPGPLQMSMPVGGYKDVSKIVESYDIIIFDIKTGGAGHYYKLEEAVNALIKQLGIPLNPSTGDYYIKDSGDYIKDSGVGIAPDKYRGTDKAQTLALRAAKILALRKLFEAVKNIHVGSDKVMSYMDRSDTIRIKIENLIKQAEFIDQKDNSDGTVEISARVRFEEIRKVCE